MKRNLITVLLSVVAFTAAYADETEDIIRNILLTHTFVFSYTLDYIEMAFKETGNGITFTFVDNDEPGQMTIDKGSVTVSGNKVLLNGEKGTIVCSLKGLNGLPDVDSRYSLVFEKNEDPRYQDNLKAGTPDDGETVAYKGIRCIKSSNDFVADADFVMYTQPDEQSPLFTSNHVYYNENNRWYYKDPNCYRILPGIKINVSAEIKNQKNILGEPGSWLLVYDDFQSEYAWIFVPDSIKKQYPSGLSSCSTCEPVSGYENCFFDALTRYNVPKLTQREIEKLNDRRGWMRFYDFSFVVDWPELKTKTAAMSADTAKSASDNLRLRSDSQLSGTIITTIKKGTKVKIIKKGRQDIIDNIYSYWVQVEVQSGGTDRDGKPVAQDTKGWCFGGYLE